MSAVTVVLAPASGYFIPDDPALLDMAEKQFRGFTEISMQSKVDAMRTQSMAKGQACFAIAITTDAVNNAKQFIADNKGDTITVGTSEFVVYESTKAWVAAVSEVLERDLDNTFKVAISQMPDVLDSSVKVYNKYFETDAYAAVQAKVIGASIVRRKTMGVETGKAKGMAVFTLAAPPGTDLSKLRAKKVPAIARGVYAGYLLSPQNGTCFILEVGGKSVQTERCCGVLKGCKHVKNAGCAAFRARRLAAGAEAEKLKPVRAIKKKAAARPVAFVGAAQELNKYADARGLEKCCAFFSNGICRRPACAAFPCGHRDNAAVEAVLKSIDM